jgi:hypothetical protein
MARALTPMTRADGRPTARRICVVPASKTALTACSRRSRSACPAWMVCSQRIEQITACLDGVTTALQSTHPDALLHEQRDWLASRIEKLRDERAALHFPAPP